MRRFPRALLLPSLALAATVTVAAAREPEPAFQQTDLVSDIPGRARVTDPNLVNPWGLVTNPAGGPWWVADNNTGLATLYIQRGDIIPVVVTLEPVTPGAAPTGIVFNGNHDIFKFTHDGNSSSADFLFATEDGFIEAWDHSVPPPAPSKLAFIQINNSRKGCRSESEINCGSVYKGLAIVTNEWGETHLLAADFRNGRVDIFDSDFAPDIRPDAFDDDTIPDGFAPFGIRAFGERVFVTYAKQNDTRHDDVEGAGNGFVDEFTACGRFVRRVASRGVLNSPWGLDFAPEGWGRLEGDLLIGNFGDGKINAFAFRHHRHGGRFEFVDAVEDANDQPIAIEGLWSIVFGPGNNSVAGPRDVLFFTAGISDGHGGPKEAHGLFGSIARVR